MNGGGEVAVNVNTAREKKYRKWAGVGLEIIRVFR